MTQTIDIDGQSFLVSVPQEEGGWIEATDEQLDALVVGLIRAKSRTLAQMYQCLILGDRP